MTYSMPMTNQTTYPMPLIGRSTSNSIADSGIRKISHDFNREEDYV